MLIARTPFSRTPLTSDDWPRTGPRCACTSPCRPRPFAPTPSATGSKIKHQRSEIKLLSTTFCRQHDVQCGQTKIVIVARQEDRTTDHKATPINVRIHGIRLQTTKIKDQRQKTVSTWNCRRTSTHSLTDSS